MFIKLKDDGRVATVLPSEVPGSLEISQEAAQNILASRVAPPKPQPAQLPEISYSIDDEGNVIETKNVSKSAKLDLPTPQLVTEVYNGYDEDLVIESVIDNLGDRVNRKVRRAMLNLGLVYGLDQPTEAEYQEIRDQVKADVEFYEAVSEARTLAQMVAPLKERDEAPKPRRLKRRKLKRLAAKADPKEEKPKENNGKGQEKRNEKAS